MAINSWLGILSFKIGTPSNAFSTKRNLSRLESCQLCRPINKGMVLVTNLDYFRHMQLNFLHEPRPSALYAPACLKLDCWLPGTKIIQHLVRPMELVMPPRPHQP